MVIMDGSFQHRDERQMGMFLNILSKFETIVLTIGGFMTDPGRCNVAMTRAKGVFMIIGGALDLRYRDNANDPLSPFVKLKKFMEERNRVHKFRS